MPKRNTAKRRKSKHLERAKRLQEMEFEQTLQQRAKKQAREEKLEVAKEKQIRENRKNEWTVVWQGGAPQ